MTNVPLAGIELARRAAQSAKWDNPSASAMIDKALAQYQKAYNTKWQVKAQISEVYRLHRADTPEGKQAAQPLKAKISRQEALMRKALDKIHSYQAQGLKS